MVYNTYKNGEKELPRQWDGELRMESVKLQRNQRILPKSGAEMES